MLSACCKRTGFLSQSRPLGFSCPRGCGWKRGFSLGREPGWHGGSEEGSLSWRISQEAESSTSRGLRLAKRLPDLNDSSFIAGRCKERERDRAVPVANAALHPAGGRSGDRACRTRRAPAVTLAAGVRASPGCLYLCILDRESDPQPGREGLGAERELAVPELGTRCCQGGVSRSRGGAGCFACVGVCLE